MIHILDEIVLEPERIEQILNTLEQDYLVKAQARGLKLLERWVSPPVQVLGVKNSLWLLWQVPDAWGYYGMRGQAGSEVPAFWAFVDDLCDSRRRHVLGQVQLPLVKPLEVEDVV